MLTQRIPRLTWKVNLPGGQSRLKEAVLYIAKACEEAEYFGLIKLNKVLWRSDFEAFAKRGQPVTGRQYQRLPLGPAAVEMLPVINDLQASGLLEFEKRPVYDFDELRPIALAPPVLRYFSKDDLHYIDEAIRYFWDWTGRITSEDSHGIAWSTHNNSDLLPYESSYLSDEPMGAMDVSRFLDVAEKKGWNSR